MGRLLSGIFRVELFVLTSRELPNALESGQIFEAAATSERNAELRRLMLERVGLDTVLAQANARLLDRYRDPGGERALYRVAVGENSHFYLRCQCASTG
jgi:hypothetical protein